jgi:pimeloyl-ACP methyl ester carboxylesterase
LLSVNEQFATVGDGVELCYETFGDPGDPAMLLIMGLGTQMVAWYDEFCQELVSRGYFVIRFDNRDVGRSTRFDHVPPPSRREILTRRPKRLAYSLADMADDAAGLLDVLGIEKAHVVGASMGGMIGQLLAARQPDRVLSFASIMSATGSRWSGQPAMRVMPMFMLAPPDGKEAYMDRIERLFKLVGSPGFEMDTGRLRELAALSYDRGVSENGLARQLGAILACGSRAKDLRRIKAPTVVIHGTKDRLVKPSGGRATARAIPGARLVMIDGMGHDLPQELWPRLIDEITRNAQRAAPRAAAGAATS